MFILKSSYCNTRRRQQMATTLMELMLVISIISVIAVFIVNRLIGSRVRAEYQQCRANLGELAQCMENYKTNEVFYYPAVGSEGEAIPISDIFIKRAMEKRSILWHKGNTCMQRILCYRTNILSINIY